MEFKTVLGMVAVGLNILAFWPYIIDTLRRKTKPHIYSWLLWTLMTTVVFIGQQADGAGAGAWVTGITAVIDLVIFLLALKFGTADITTSDKICLASALVIMVIWLFSNSLVLSIVLITLVDTLAFIPTIRKTLKAPHEETFITYPLSTVRCLLGILALANYSIITCAYPIAMLVMYALITGILLYKRPQNIKELRWSRIKRHYFGYFGKRQAAQASDATA
ncbi:MAG TPA: hypothetical protein VFZ48_03135 [Candidatus Saccharimonadales bacterium]